MISKGQVRRSGNGQETIEYDPNRSARIGHCLETRDGDRRYIIAPALLQVGDAVVSGKGAEITKASHCL